MASDRLLESGQADSVEFDALLERAIAEEEVWDAAQTNPGFNRFSPRGDVLHARVGSPVPAAPGSPDAKAIRNFKPLEALEAVALGAAAVVRLRAVLDRHRRLTLVRTTVGESLLHIAARQGKVLALIKAM